MIAVTAVTVASPPWIDLLITGLPAGTTSIAVDRAWGGSSVDRVRGDSTTPIFGTEARLVDWASPVGVGAITYTVSALSAAGVVLETKALTVASVAIGHNSAWLSDPMDPTGGVLVTLMRHDGDTRSAPGADVVSTATGLPLALVAHRSMRARDWRLFAGDDTLADAIDWILGSSSVLLRAAPDCLDHPTGVAYVQAASVSRRRRVPHKPGVLWEMSGVETRGPAAPPAVSGRTYQDDLDEHAIYSASLAAFPTYLARVRG